MRTVLVIDDSALMRRMMSNILMRNGYQIVGEAPNGRIGVDKFKELAPDIVTMDVIMDEMNGIEALGEIMRLNNKAKVVMVSSMGQEIIVREAIVAGAKSFILKPYDEKLVVDTLSGLFSHT